MDQMEILRETGESPDTTVFLLKGPFTLSTLFPFQAELREPGLKNVIIDFTAVPYIDSAGLGVLLGHYAHSQRAGFKMALSGVSPRVHTIFEITHTDTLMLFYPSTEAAEAAFAKG